MTDTKKQEIKAEKHGDWVNLPEKNNTSIHKVTWAENNYDLFPLIVGFVNSTDVINAVGSVAISGILWVSDFSEKYEPVKNALIGANVTASAAYLTAISTEKSPLGKTLSKSIRNLQTWLTYPLISYAYSKFAQIHGYNISTLRFILPSILFSVFAYLCENNSISKALDASASVTKWACFIIALTFLLIFLREVYNASKFLDTENIKQKLDIFFYIAFVVYLFKALVPNHKFSSTTANLVNLAVVPFMSLYFRHIMLTYP